MSAHPLGNVGASMHIGAWQELAYFRALKQAALANVVLDEEEQRQRGVGSGSGIGYGRENADLTAANVAAAAAAAALAAAHSTRTMADDPPPRRREQHVTGHSAAYSRRGRLQGREPSSHMAKLASQNFFQQPSPSSSRQLSARSRASDASRLSVVSEPVIRRGLGQSSSPAGSARSAYGGGAEKQSNSHYSKSSRNNDTTTNHSMSTSTNTNRQVSLSRRPGDANPPASARLGYQEQVAAIRQQEAAYNPGRALSILRAERQTRRDGRDMRRFWGWQPNPDTGGAAVGEGATRRRHAPQQQPQQQAQQQQVGRDADERVQHVRRMYDLYKSRGASGSSGSNSPTATTTTTLTTSSNVIVHNLPRLELQRDEEAPPTVAAMHMATGPAAPPKTPDVAEMQLTNEHFGQIAKYFREADDEGAPVLASEGLVAPRSPLRHIGSPSKTPWAVEGEVDDLLAWTTRLPNGDMM